jgi:hypothetical protein
MKYARLELDVVTNDGVGDWDCCASTTRNSGWSIFARKRHSLLARDHGFAPLDGCRWIDLPNTNAKRVKAGRVVGQLERLGLIERYKRGKSDRTTHVRLTEAGKHIVKRLTEENPPAASRRSSNTLTSKGCECKVKGRSIKCEFPFSK